MSDSTKFTPAERDVINKIAAGEVENVSIEDAKIYARWECANALQDEEHKAKLAALDAEMQVRLQASADEHAYAMQTLEQLRNAAVARLGSIENDT